MGTRLMSLDYGYGDAIERGFAERADDESELAFAVLHGLVEPYELAQPPAAWEGAADNRKAAT